MHSRHTVDFHYHQTDKYVSEVINRFSEQLQTNTHIHFLHVYTDIEKKIIIGESLIEQTTRLRVRVK